MSKIIDSTGDYYYSKDVRLQGYSVWSDVDDTKRLREWLRMGLSGQCASLTGGMKVDVNLSCFPCRDYGLLGTVGVMSLRLIVIIALLTMYYNQKAMKVKSGANEACCV